mmetsp:Transcript_30852/g.62233  ORF Transcript_30852/g.62233 Transcript_30852/m.62233 type:complete len:347 (-) Transcript_30852:559-1599(-)
MGRRPGELGEGETALLPAAQVLHGLQGEVPLEAEAAEVLARLLHRDLAGAVVLDAPGAQAPHVHHRVLLRVHHLDVVLREARQRELGVSSHGALRGLQGAVQQLQEGGLTRAVGADDGHPRVAIHAEVQILVEDSVLRVPEGGVDDGDAWRRQRGCCREVELQVGVVEVYTHRLLLQLAEHLHSALRLLRHLLVAVAEPGDELLQVGDLALLLRGHGLLVHPLLGAHSQEGVVVAAIVPEPLLLAEDGGLRALVEEGPVVRHDDHRLLPGLQELLEPRHRVHVEVIRGLVQEQQVRLDEERLGQRNAHAPPAAELLGWPLLVIAMEAQARENHRGARLGIIAAELL